MSVTSDQPVSSELPGQTSEQQIVFYDGECALCNGFVEWLLRRDRRRVLHFAPLQGETAARTIGKLEGDPDEWTIILLDSDGRHERSDAAIRILRQIGGVCAVAGAIRILPRRFRDWCYRLIARRRRGWFGRADACRLPTIDERRQLLP